MRALRELLPQLGHRNWVAVVDAAFPELIAPGIAYGASEELESVVAALADCRHVRAEPFIDSEIAKIEESDAPGIDAFRSRLDSALSGLPVRRLPHEEIIAMLDEAAKTFRVVIVKTDLTIPYTSVFFRLECGYWNPESESRLRQRMSGGSE